MLIINVMCFFLLLITIFYVFFTLKVLFFIINSHKFLVETQLEITVQRAAQVILEQRVSELEKKSNEKYDELLFENTILRITLIIHKKHITELTTLNDNDNNNDNYDETYNRILKQIEKMKTQCKNSLNSPTISRLPIIKSRKLGSISSIPITHKSS